MRHHAHTNDPLRDPDHFTAGSMAGVLTAWLGQVMLITFLPVFVLVPPARRLIPKRMQLSMAAGGDNRDGLRQLRFWFLTTAVFPGSGLLIRGHDHHAVHHLFLRVPHYRLAALWQDIAEDMVEKGVRCEGSATASTGPIIW